MHFGTKRLEGVSAAVTGFHGRLHLSDQGTSIGTRNIKTSQMVSLTSSSMEFRWEKIKYKHKWPWSEWDSGCGGGCHRSRQRTSGPEDNEQTGVPGQGLGGLMHTEGTGEGGTGISSYGQEPGLLRKHWAAPACLYIHLFRNNFLNKLDKTLFKKSFHAHYRKLRKQIIV